jgi:3-oxoacyl-[acyl-carrier protein] reductase
MRDLVLITGASSELGRNLIARLARCGNPGRIILAHYFTNSRALNEIRKSFPQPGQLVLLQADFSDTEAVRRLADRVIAEFGAPDKIVHLPAERLRYERFAKCDLARFDRDFSIQFKSAAALFSALLPLSAQARKKAPTGDAAIPNAKVVFVLSSVVIGAPPKFMAMYTAVKYALLGLMRSLAAEYADCRINVNAVSPSMMETQFLASIPAKAVELSAAASPTGRNTSPADVTPVIEFLLSPESDYTTGVNIPVTGGALF